MDQHAWKHLVSSPSRQLLLLPLPIQLLLLLLRSNKLLLLLLLLLPEMDALLLLN
jgi:hypothetical protein